MKRKSFITVSKGPEDQTSLLGFSRNSSFSLLLNHQCVLLCDLHVLVKLLRDVTDVLFHLVDDMSFIHNM